MQMKSAVLILVPIFALIGCAAPPQLADLKTPQAKAAPVSLASNLCTKISGVLGNEAEVCVLSGSFFLEKENALGQLYLGSQPSVYWKVGDDVVLYQGGIWLPRDGAQAPRVYFYPTGGMIRGKSIAEIERARTASAPTPSQGGASQVAVSAAIQNPPATATPAQAGVGAGIAAGIVGSLTSGPPEPMIYGEPKTPAFTEAVRQAFAKTQRVP